MKPAHRNDRGVVKVEERPAASLTNEGRHHLLVDAITDYAIYMLDGSGLVTSWNSGAKRFKGYEEAEILGKHFAIFYTDEDRRDGLPGRALTRQLGAVGSKVRAGGYARTVTAFGPMSLSTPFGMERDICWDSLRLLVT